MTAACGSAHLGQAVQGLLGLQPGQRLHILLGDDGVLQLLQPGPHEAGEDEGVSLHAQALPRTFPGVQLTLQDQSYKRVHTSHTGE